MRVALLGNMNNNNFAILRYMVDLGVDAYLILFKDDGEGSISHFKPDNDSWYLGKWEKRIVRMDYYADWRAFYPDLKLKSLPPSVNHIRNTLNDFDVFIGSGMIPAIFDRVGMKLDIFYPYATGVEMIGTNLWPSYFQKRFSIRKWLYQRLINAQIRGVKSAKNCLNAELGPTKETLDKLGVSFDKIPTPMVYPEIVPFEIVKDDEQLSTLLRQLESCDLKIMSHARHWWINKQSMDELSWQGLSKNNNWLIEGFASFLTENSRIKACLILLEYGDDVKESKSLVQKLGIANEVIWLPRMSRKKLLYLISQVDIGVGQFTVAPGTIWGGTGWETMAMGKPMLQAFNFTQQEFIEIFGYEAPPLLDVKSAEDVKKHLVDYFQSQEKFVEMGMAARDWFNTYNGQGLVIRWLDVIQV